MGANRIGSLHRIIDYGVVSPWFIDHIRDAWREAHP